LIKTKRLVLLVLLLLAFAIAAGFASVGGSWKWVSPRASGYLIAGWTWGGNPQGDNAQGDQY
jgi:hypothetical protein